MIPDKINIVGVPYKVMLLKDNFVTDSHFGEIDYTEATIKINQDMPEPLQMQALCHEWLHGALVMLGFNDQTQDDQFVQALSAAINMSFKPKEE
jgi:hypothetical protein